MSLKTCLQIISVVALFLSIVIAAKPRTLAQNPTPDQNYFLSQMNPPYVLPDAAKVEADIVFDSPNGRDLHLDLFLPKTGKGPFPAILFIQGSGYNGNNKSCFWREAAYFATRGFIGACIEHRALGPDGVTWPAILADIRTSLDWIQSDGIGYGVDPDRVGVLGGSSGGHLAAMIGVSPNEGDSTHAAVRGVVVINALLDPPYFAEHKVFSKEYQFEIDTLLTHVLGAAYTDSPDLWISASPLKYVSSDDPPFLIIQGSKDGTMPVEQIDSMRAALIQARVPVETAIIDGGTHEMLNSPSIYYDVLARTEEFLVRVLKKGKR